MTQRASFRQADLTRAIKAALDAGLAEGSFVVECREGAIRVLTGTAAQTQPLSPLERWELENGHRAA